MAHLLTFPATSRGIPWLSRTDRLPAARSSTDGPGTWFTALDALLESLRLAWWDGSALGLSRGGLASLVGLEPGDATPPRLVAVEARVRMQAEVRA